MEVVLSQPAGMALRSLTDEDRRQAAAWFDHLRNWESDDFIRSRAHALKSDPSVFVLRTTSDIRIFFTIDDGKIVIVDLARRQALEQFKNSTVRVAHEGIH